jgi:hypothetical protein
MASEPKELFFEQPLDIVKAYETGFVGAICDPEHTEALQASIQAAGGIPSGAMACSTFGLEETGAGKLSLPFLEIYKVYPESLPGGAQGRGDCVSWSTRNACLGTMCCEITSGMPDEVTNKLEGAPEVTDEARLSGVLSTEAFYNWRGHGGDGWFCSDAAGVAMTESGLWLRKNYPEIGVDFTRYSSRNAGLYGRSPPPKSWLAIGKDRLVRTATVLDSYETLRDMLANGYCVSSCGGESWSDKRDENGFSRRTSAGWAHALAYLGVDDRPEIIEIYKEPLVLVVNSWGNWNDGSRRIYGTNINIPIGSFWSRWSDMRRREMIAFSGVSGWPRAPLNNYGAIGNI